MVSVDIREKDRPCRFWTLTGRYSRRRVIRRRPRALGNLFIIKHKRSALTKRHRHCVVGWFSKLNHERIKNTGRSVGTVKSSNFASARNSPAITVFKVFRITGKPGNAGINKQVVRDEGTLQERKTANPPGLKSCRRDIEVLSESYTGESAGHGVVFITAIPITIIIAASGLIC